MRCRPIKRRWEERKEGATEQLNEEGEVKLRLEAVSDIHHGHRSTGDLSSTVTAWNVHRKGRVGARCSKRKWVVTVDLACYFL